MAQFVYTCGGVECALELSGEVLIAGSDPSCGLVLADPSVSAVHCEFRVGSGGLRVVDLESRTGTSVNGEYVNQRVLAEGDTIQIGDVRGVVRGIQAPARPTVPSPTLPPAIPAAAAAAAAASPAVRPPAPAKALQPRQNQAPARRGAPSSSGSRGRRDEVEEDEPPRRASARKSDRGTVVFLTIGALLALGILAWVMRPKGHATKNERIYSQMVERQGVFDWDGVIALSADADGNDPSDRRYYAEIQTLKTTAEQGRANAGAKDRTAASVRAWNEILVWWQNDFKDQDELRRRIDEFLGTYGDLGSVAPTQAREMRVKYFGSAMPGVVPAGSEGWKLIVRDSDILVAAGRFGEALDKIDAWWRDNGATSGALQGPVDTQRENIRGSAGKWLDRQLMTARMALGRGEKTKARRLIREAAANIGIPELAAKANEELAKIE